MLFIWKIGDLTDGDWATYPDDDLIAKASDNGWSFTHKNGEIYED
jgi:uncharacterized cupin superfamily protein